MLKDFSELYTANGKKLLSHKGDLFHATDDGVYPVVKMTLISGQSPILFYSNGPRNDLRCESEVVTRGTRKVLSKITTCRRTAKIEQARCLEEQARKIRGELLKDNHD